MGGNGDHYIKQNKPDSEKEVSHFLSYREPRGAIKWHENRRDTTREEGMGTRGVIGTEYNQSMSYTSMEMSWNPLFCRVPK
jgi:hypothetical protein